MNKEIALFLTTLLCTVIANPVFASHSFVVEGVSDASLLKVQSALQKAAYGSDGLRTDIVQMAAGSDVTTIDPTDACDAFYEPPAKLRIIKRLPTHDPCIGKKAAVVVETESRILFLCKNGRTVADYDFSIGQYGTGKKIEGDKRTPLGTYPLSAPRKSAQFKVFIPIGYPTPKQRQLGYTGSDIGIHGPSRMFRCAGFFNVLVNWTQGCVAVASDVFVKEIGQFIELNSVSEIEILPDSSK